jgi:AhpD family alkylhydroperoxidase
MPIPIFPIYSVKDRPVGLHIPKHHPSKKNMNRIHPLPADKAPKTVAALYEAVRQDMSLVPNLVRTLGNSHASLDAYLKLNASLANGKLPPSLREKLALRIAKLNGCDYCLAIHHAIGSMLGIPAEELVLAEGGLSRDTREQAALDLAEAVLATRGNISADFYKAVTMAGISSEDSTEIVAHVAKNVFANYFTRFAQTEIDFPRNRSNASSAA